MFDVVSELWKEARELGVTFHTNPNIRKIIVKNKTANAISSKRKTITSDLVLALITIIRKRC
jgi:phytoene dehydrogenase-like protein